MRTTLSLLPDGRVASATDFLLLGEGIRRTPPGWRHVLVDFEFEPDGQVFAFRSVADIDTGRTLAAELSVNAMNAIAKHCRAYHNLIGRLSVAPA